MNQAFRQIASRNLGRARVGYAHPVGKDLLGYTDPGGQLLSTDNKIASATFIISTSTQDRDGDIVVPLGFNLTNFRKNPLFFFSHQAWPLPIGIAENPLTKALEVS